MDLFGEKEFFTGCNYWASHAGIRMWSEWKAEEVEKDLKLLAEYGMEYHIYSLNEFAGDSTKIPDPYGQPLTAYGECFEVLRVLVRKLAEKLDSLVEEEI